MTNQVEKRKRRLDKTRWQKTREQEMIGKGGERKMRRDERRRNGTSGGKMRQGKIRGQDERTWGDDI